MQPITYHVRRFLSPIDAQLVQQEGDEYLLNAPNYPERHLQLFLKISEELHRPIFGTKAKLTFEEATVVRFYVKRSPLGDYLLQRHADLTPAELRSLNQKEIKTMAACLAQIILPIVGFIAGYCFYGWATAIAGVVLGALMGYEISWKANETFFLDPNVNLHLFHPISNISFKMDILKNQYTREQIMADLALAGVELNADGSLPFSAWQLRSSS